MKSMSGSRKSKPTNAADMVAKFKAFMAENPEAAQLAVSEMRQTATEDQQEILSQFVELIEQDQQFVERLKEGVEAAAEYMAVRRVEAICSFGPALKAAKKKHGVNFRDLNLYEVEEAQELPALEATVEVQP